MPVTVVVGGQFGGEGKGKTAHFLAQETGARIAIRVGGTNSGHTVIDPSGCPIILRQLPTPSILPDVICVLGAGSYVSTEILLEEIKRTKLSSDRLYIDPNAMIITKDDLQEEANSALRKTIGSTLSGTGAAVKRRMSRVPGAKLAKDEDCLKQYVRPVIELLRDNLSDGERIIIEGTQGFGLSLLHSPYYPFSTSRDTTAAAFVSEAGLSPLDVDDIVLALRTFPIRVGGNSGPLPDEIDWNILTVETQSTRGLFETTSVTKTIRRVARFNADIVRKAIMTNQPNRIVLNHLDYIDSNYEKSKSISEKGFSFIRKVESQIGKKIDYLGFGRASLVRWMSKYSEVSNYE